MNIEQALFIAFIIGMTLVVLKLAALAQSGSSVKVLIGLSTWFAYVYILWSQGILQRTETLPPGMFYILVPVVLFLIIVISVILPPAGEKIVTSLPLQLIIGAQVFRVIVELFIHQMWLDGIVPQTLTFNGSNFDIYIGSTAPIIAFLSTRAIMSRVVLLWNVFGLFALANVVTHALLTAPGPLNIIHAELPNKMFMTFPYMFIPAFFVPIAITLHILAIRSVLTYKETQSVKAF